MWIKVFAIVGAIFALLAGVLYVATHAVDVTEWGLQHVYDPKTPSGPDWLVRMASYCMITDDDAEAVKILQLLLANHPMSERAAEAQYMIGTCDKRMNDPRQARNDFQKVIDNYPGSEWTQKAREQVKKLDAVM